MSTPGDDMRGDGPFGGQFPAADVTARQFERTCRAVVEGRRAARALASWSKPFELNESDLQVLWALHLATPDRLNQSLLAGLLVVSPAQMSVTVERLRARNWIEQLPTGGDRRRNHWQLTADGQRLLARVMAAAARRPHELPAPDSGAPTDGASIPQREEAA